MLEVLGGGNARCEITTADGVREATIHFNGTEVKTDDSFTCGARETKKQIIEVWGMRLGRLGGKLVVGFVSRIQGEE